METKDKYKLIRYIYLYLVTAITIIILIISASGLIRIVLEEYVFDVKGYDEFESSYEYRCSDDALFYEYQPGSGERVPIKPGMTQVEKDMDKEECLAKAKAQAEEMHINDLKRDLVQYISLLLVALPLYLYHWGIIRRESKKK